jgi:prepilin-type N-terminal cleavage/methylation domain-containing protein
VSVRRRLGLAQLRLRGRGHGRILQVVQQPRRPRVVRHVAHERGFSLVELLTVVVIMGILAVLGMASLRKHVSSSKSIEAFNMIQSIRAAQERWRAEHMIYLDATTDAGGWYPMDPTKSDARGRERAFFGQTANPDAGNWLLLRPTVSGPVQFAYRTNAGAAGATMPDPEITIPGFAWPENPNNWYVIQALGDTDGDGEPSYYIASSLDGEVGSVNDGE